MTQTRRSQLFRAALAAQRPSGRNVTVAERVSGADARPAGLDQRLQRQSCFRILDDPHDEDDETLQGVAHAKDVLQRHFDGTDGQRSRDPGDAQEGHDGDGAAYLRHRHRRRRFSDAAAHFAHRPRSLPL